MIIRRLGAALVAVAATLTLPGCGAAAPAPVDRPTAQVGVGAPVPPAWSGQGRVRVGIACDYPPFGYTSIDGTNAGYDAEVGRTIAAYAFGDDTKVDFTCVTPQNRIPYLQSGKIDLIISTLGYTKERAQTIDYSVPYFTSGAKLLVKIDSTVTDWSGITDNFVITKTGTTSSTFLTNCYAKSPQLLLDSTSDAVAALKASRGVAFAEDSTLLLGLTLNDPTLKVVGDDKAETPWGLGIRKGDTATKTYVDAVFGDMQKKDTFWAVFGRAVTDEGSRDAFAKNMPRPGQDLAYTDEDTLSKCAR